MRRPGPPSLPTDTPDMTCRNEASLDPNALFDSHRRQEAAHRIAAAWAVVHAYEPNRLDDAEEPNRQP